MATELKLAIAHDWLTNLGGGERVVEVLSKTYPSAPIYTSVYNDKGILLFDDKKIITSFLQRWPLARKKHQIYSLLRTLAFESFDLSDYNVVISSSSAESKGVITNTETLHVAYIHTPTRYFWSGYDEYLDNPGLGLLNPLARIVLPRAVGKMRNWDFAAAQRPDIVLANSKTVQDRIKKYYRRDSIIVYPPVNTDRFKSKKSTLGDYYLVVSRLIPYKRVDLAIEACNKLGRKLIVVGSGSEQKRLKAIAGKNIEFITDATDEQVTKLYLSCKGFIFTGFEDFGITPVEAMAAGKPVVAFGRGGASESVVHKKTGILFKHQNTNSVVQAIKELESTNFKEDLIKQRAEEFSETVFVKNIDSIINKYLSEK